MRYYARFGVGLLVGLLAAVGVGFMSASTWPVAATGAFVGMLGFLATFFIWSSDREPSEEEPEGYEQVLFDARNNVHLVVMLMLVAGGAYGHAFAFDGGAGEAATAPDPAVAQMDAANSELVTRVNDFTAIHAAFKAGTADAAALRAQDDAATQLRLDLEALETTGALEDRRAALSDAAALMGAAYALLASCVEQEADDCMDALLLQAKAASALGAAKVDE